MKAEERHELQQNDLEEYTDKLKPFLQKYGRTLGLIAVAGVLLLVAISVFADRSRAGSEAGWGDYFTARDAAGFEAVADLDAGSNAAVWARVAAGETYLAEANDAAYTDRAAADDALDGARTNFQAVLDDGSAPEAATAKALYGMAAVEEATGGGDLAAAKARLEELVADYPNSPARPRRRGPVEGAGRPLRRPVPGVARHAGPDARGLRPPPRRLRPRPRPRPPRPAAGVRADRTARRIDGRRRRRPGRTRARGRRRRRARRRGRSRR